jgi:hypothetical protein
LPASAFFPNSWENVYCGSVSNCSTKAKPEIIIPKDLIWKAPQRASNESGIGGDVVTLIITVQQKSTERR